MKSLMKKILGPVLSDLLSRATYIVKYTIFGAIILPIILSVLHSKGISVPGVQIPDDSISGTFHVQESQVSEALRIMIESVKDFLSK